MTDDSQTPGVSVVVPVYNPGPYARPLLDSLDRQVRPEDGFEAILVDDGSTDGTGRLLDHWAATRPWAQIIHQPNSGWPSRPRNVGLDAARGEYVYLVDHDDWLADDALDRMLRFARENRSDVVIGRIQGVHRKVPSVLFRETRPDARPPHTPLQDSMTPHTMFRRGFLESERLRFDETARRVEDHIFLASAYVRSQRTSVLSGEPIYFHARRDDGAGAGFRAYRANQYYPYLERAIDIVLTSGAPEAEQNAYLARWMRIELVGRLMSEVVRWLPHDEREEFFDAVRRILRTRIPPSALRSLSSTWRWPAALAATATSDEFYRAIDVIEAGEARGPGSHALAESVDSARLAEAVALIGADEPLPPAPSSRAARLRRTLLAAVARATGGRLQRRLAAWGRTPTLLARQAAAVASPVLAAIAAVMAALGAFPIVAVILVTLSIALTVGLAVRSTSGTGTAFRQAVALVPALVVAVRAPGPALIGAIVVAALAIVGAALADRAWRARDIRSHGVRRGGPIQRLGWIGAAALAVGAAVAGVDAGALLTANGE
jgi:glycosyltransferase involved in cell wall biosynthesis